MKIPDTFENCLRSGGTQGGGNVNKTVSFNAPNEPGIYYMQFGGSLQYSCTGASDNSEFGDKSVATIMSLFSFIWIRIFDKISNVFFFSIIPCAKLKEFNNKSLLAENCISFF